MKQYNKQKNDYHKAVLVDEMLAYMAPQPHKLYVDATFGGGTHTRALLEAEPTCKVIALDWDRTPIEKHATALKEEFGNRLTLIWGNFAHLKYLLKKEGVTQVDGILADFGTSQYQIHNKPGFSFATDTLLDMRMSPAHQEITASLILNTASEKELATIFKEYGEEHAARAIARAVVAKRASQKLKTTKDLIDIITQIKPAYKTKIHPATKVFQALRMVVNKEIENISALLSQTLELLAPQGRIVCISFHSGEDRMVKNFFRENAQSLALLTPKIVTGKNNEISANPSARSAKLRACRKIF